MKWCYITFRSITPAQRGEAALSRGGISCSLRRTPSWMAEQGCGYCLRMKPGDAQTAGAILRRNRIPFRKGYLLDDEGNGEAVAL